MCVSWPCIGVSDCKPARPKFQSLSQTRPHLGRGRPIGDTRSRRRKMRSIENRLLCLAAAAPARAGELRASEAARASARPPRQRARARGPRPRPPRLRRRIPHRGVSVACDADTLRDKCCIHEGEVATLLTVAMEAQSRAIAPRICAGGVHGRPRRAVPFVGACTGPSCGGRTSSRSAPRPQMMRAARTSTTPT